MSPPPSQQRQQHQRTLPNLAAAVDGILFLAACAVSPQWNLSLAPAGQWLAGGRKGNSGAAGAHPQQQQDWRLLCTPSSNGHPPETLPVRVLTDFFVSLRQLLPRLPQSAVTRLIAPLFALGRSIGFVSHRPAEAPEDVRDLAEALGLLLHGVLQRAAAEAPTLPPGDTVQRVSTVCSALTDWSKRLASSHASRLVPLLLLGDPRNVQDLIQEEDFLEVPAAGPPGGPTTTALAVALHRSGAPMLPSNILQATASMIEASAVAACRGLQGIGAPPQRMPGVVEAPVRLHQRADGSQEALAKQQQQEKQEEQTLKLGASPPLQTPIEELRQLVTARASWLPVYYLLMRLSGGIWLPAVQQLAEAAAAQGARLIELFISQQQRQRDLREPEETRNAAWAAVGRMLHVEVQQLSTSLARLHSLRPLRGMARFAGAAVAFDRFLNAQQMPSSSSDGGAATAAGASGEAAVQFLRPLLHTHEPPRDLKEAEKRIRFFCSLVTLGATDPSLVSGVASCLPSEGQISSLGFTSTHQPTTKQQLSSSRGAAAVATLAQQLPIKLIQRLLFACSWIGDWSLVVMGLKLLRHRLDTLTLQRLLGASTSASSSRDGRSTHRFSSKVAAAEDDADERHTAELVGKTLALLHKNYTKWRVSKGGRSSRSSSLASTPRPQGEIWQLQDALCSLASAATLWAAVSGFEKQRPEDVALLTFSLIPFWAQETSEGAAPVHTQQQVQTIRAAAAAAAAAIAEEHDGKEAPQQQPRRRLQEGLNTAALTRSLKGFYTFSSASDISPARYVDSSAVEFYLSELREKRGPGLTAWPPPLLFLLAYNLLRLRRSRGNESFRESSDAATTAAAESQEAGPVAGRSAGGASAPQSHQQQLSSEAEAMAAQLLLGVVAAVEGSVSFPDSVNSWYRGKAPSGPPADASKAPAKSTAQSKGAASVAATSGAPAAPGQGEIRRAGMREVGSFLWALNRTEGGLGAPEAMEDAALLSAAADTAGTPQLPLGNSERHAKLLTLQQAARIAARSIRRPGGFADKLALYCEAAIRAANDCLLQRGGLARTPTACTADAGRAAQQSSFAAPGAVAACGELATVASGGELDGDYLPQNVLARLKAYCLKAPIISKPPITLLPQERPPTSWVSTAGVSLGLLLNFFSSCRTETRRHILWVTLVALHLSSASRSGIVHAPLLAAECGLLQLFHLLRPLAAAGRAGAEESEALESEKGNAGPLEESLPSAASASDPSKLQTPMTGQQLLDRANNSYSSSLLRLFQGAAAFLFAVAAALLRHAQSIAALPADSPRTAAQLQLLLLASSDFATLLHAHCGFTPAGAARAEEGEAQGAASTIPVVTASADFQRVMQELLSVFSSLVVRHAPQIRDSLALLAAAAETLSLCGRYVPLPKGSKKALESFASAAITALRQPPPYQTGQRGSLATPSPHAQRGGGAEELRRLATAVEALKFVQLK
ncbi:hypothetical protein, conserved [Eimeria praecox]|uniref:Uncharacterized protein n=1 Tax=Eimeria praecox TaxID=51316 RepID=U6GHX8_9EIME|nr:hypothetical protein, conserved [Eimeria praecox]